jgi:putative transposase
MALPHFKAEYKRPNAPVRNVNDRLALRGVCICHESARLWWNRFGPKFGAEISKTRVGAPRVYTYY